MTQPLKDAIKKVEGLPEELQAYAADVLEQIAAGGPGHFSIPPDDREAVEEGLAQTERGEVVDVKDSVLNQAWR